MASSMWGPLPPLILVRPGIIAFLTVSGSAVVTGTAAAGINEDDVVAGGKTIIITLTGDTWIAAGALSFDLIRQDIINGLDSAQSELLGWNNVVQALQSVAGVVRTSDTIVTITLDAFATYNITAQETITVTVPATALTGGSPIVATPTFSVTTTVSVGEQMVARHFGATQPYRMRPQVVAY